MKNILIIIALTFSCIGLSAQVSQINTGDFRDISVGVVDPVGAPSVGGPQVYQNLTDGDLFVWDGANWVKPGAEGLIDLDEDTEVRITESGGVNGGDIIEHYVDGILTYSSEILVGGIVKTTIPGILDPILYRPTHMTTAVRDATYTPIAVEGDLIYNVTEGAYQFYDGSVWAELLQADLNTTVSDETGANGTSLTTPTSAPTANPDIGDLHIEVYDDVILYFTAVAGNWTAPTVIEIPIADDNSILERDVSQSSDRTHDMNSNNLTFNEVGNVTFNEASQFDIEALNALFFPGIEYHITAAPGSGATMTGTDGTHNTDVTVGADNVEMEMGDATDNARVFIQDGTVAGQPQIHMETAAVHEGTAIAGQPMALSGTNGEVEYVENVFTTDGVVQSRAFNRQVVSASAGTNIIPDVSVYQNLEYNITSGSTGNITLNGATGGTSNDQVFIIHFNNNDVITRTVTFNPGDYNTIDSEDPKDIEIPAGETVHLTFVGGITGQSNTLVSGGGGGGIGEEDQTLIAERNVFQDGNRLNFYSGTTATTTEWNAAINESGSMWSRATRTASQTETAVTAQNVVIGRPNANSLGTNRILNIDGTSTGTVNITLVGGGGFGTGEYTHIQVNNDDGIDRDIQFDATSFFKRDGVTPVGTITIPAGEQRTYEFLGFDLLKARWVDEYLAGSATTVYINSSGGAVNEVLPNATASESIIFYTNQDVSSNEAKLTVPVGESLNGVTDGEFFFSNYADGTQFRVDDKANGEWVVTVQGASVEQSLDRFFIRGVSPDMSFPNDGVWRLAIDLSSLVDGNEQIVREYDPSGLRTGSTITIKNSGEYRILMQANHSQVNESGTSGQNAFASQMEYSINGGTPVTIGQETDTNEVDGELNGFELLNLTAGDVLEFYIKADDNRQDEDYMVILDISQLASNEVVLAGMVTPTTLERVYMTTSTTSMNDASPTLPLGDAAWDAGLQIDANGIINTTGDYLEIKKAGTYQVDITGSVDPNNTTEHEVDIELNGTTVARSMLDDGSGGTSARMGFSATYVGSLSIGDQIAFTKNVTANEWENIQIHLQELPASEVVMPGAITPESLAHVVYSLSADSASSLVCPFDEGQGDTSVITNSGGTITLPVGKYRIEAHASRHAGNLDYELYNVTTSTVLERYSTASDAGVTHPYYLTVNTPTEIQIREGDVSTAVVWNGRQSGFDAGFDDAQKQWGTYIDIEQLPSSTVVMPDALAVEDLAVTLFTKASVADGVTATLDSGVTWADVKADYEVIEVFAETGGIVYMSARFLASDIVDSGQLGFSYGGASRIDLESINLADGDFLVNTSDGSTAEYEIVGYKAQKTVINTADIPVDDQTASGYMDIGNMRMQWGQVFLASGSGEVITLPAAFANNTYSFTANGHNTNDPRNITIEGQTTTTVTVDQWKADDRTVATGLINWQAIGLKP